VRHKAGYVMVWAPEHPRSRNNARYVFEHILVMEKTLGRYLVGRGVGPPPQRCSRRQPSREPRTVDPSAAFRHTCQRRDRMGTRTTREVRRGWQHLQQCSGRGLSTLGGGGDRTRVLQYITRASPGAALLCFSQPRQSRRRAADGLSRCLVSRLVPRPD
jgi:hypothetical protein